MSFGGRHRSPTRWRGVVVTTVAAALVATTAWAWASQVGPDDSGRPAVGRSGPAAATDPTSPTSQASPEIHASKPVVPARRAGGVVPEVPRRSVLPDGTVVPVRAVGTDRDGTLAVPHDIRVAGWWRGGARLGDPFGSLLLAAHVDSTTQGLGPYASLLSVRAGQRITVTSAHLRQTFAVASLSLVPRHDLTGQPRIFSARGPHRLTLVTCAGPYDASRGGYQNLAVVTARPVGDVVGRRPR